MVSFVRDLQESRIGKAVEVMIQHVENLRRLYTKEHAELLELRETLMQNERSFGSQTEKGCTQRHTKSDWMQHTIGFKLLQTRNYFLYTKLNSKYALGLVMNAFVAELT